MGDGIGRGGRHLHTFGKLLHERLMMLHSVENTNMRKVFSVYKYSMVALLWLTIKENFEVSKLLFDISPM